MDTARHRQAMNLLIDSLALAWKDRSDFFVGGNMFLYFSLSQTRKNDFRGPDVFVVLGTEKRERLSWVVWEEDGQTPDVVIELTSPSTEAIDRGQKMVQYARRLHVKRYYIFDPFSARLDGYRLRTDRDEYEPLDPLPNGDLPCDLLGLALGVRPGVHQGVDAPWLRWLDGEGRPLPSPEETAEAETGRARANAERAQAEAERAQVEAERAQAEAERAQAEAERAQAEAERAQAEAARADAAEQRAEAERRRADALAQRLAELERRLGTGT